MPLDFLTYFSLAHRVPIEVYKPAGSGGLDLVMALQPVFEAGHVNTLYPVGGCVTLLAESTLHGHVVTRSRRHITPANCSWAGVYSALMKNVHFQQDRHGLCKAFVQAGSPCIPSAPGSYLSPDVRCPEKYCAEHCQALCSTPDSIAHCVQPPRCFLRGAAPTCAGHCDGHSLASRGRRCPAQRRAIELGRWQAGQQLPCGEWFGACAAVQPHLFDFYSASCPDNLCYSCGIYAALLGLHRCAYHIAHLDRSRSTPATAVATGSTAGVLGMEVESDILAPGPVAGELEMDHDFDFDFEQDNIDDAHSQNYAQVIMNIDKCCSDNGEHDHALTTCL
jgi:hypothetical protein